MYVRLGSASCPSNAQRPKESIEVIASAPGVARDRCYFRHRRYPERCAYLDEAAVAPVQITRPARAQPPSRACRHPPTTPMLGCSEALRQQSTSENSSRPHRRGGLLDELHQAHRVAPSANAAACCQGQCLRCSGCSIDVPVSPHRRTPVDLSAGVVFAGRRARSWIATGKVQQIRAGGACVVCARR